MNSEQHRGEDWPDCPPGELSSMVARLNATERRQSMGRTLAVTAASGLIAAVGIVAWGALSTHGEPNFGGIVCSNCRPYLASHYEIAFGEGPTPDNPLVEDEELAQRVAIHLSKCKLCRAKFDMMYPGVLDPLEVAGQLSPHAVPLLADFGRRFLQ